MIDQIEAVIAELEEQIDELEDAGADEDELAPLRERLAQYESRAQEEELGQWLNHAAQEA